MVKIIKKGGGTPAQQSTQKGIVDTAWDTAKNAAKLYQSYSDLSSPENQLRGISQFGQGAAEGVASLLGLPGTLYNVARAGTGYLFGKENPLPENTIIPTGARIAKRSPGYCSSNSP